jgi:hypothetical protein
MNEWLTTGQMIDQLKIGEVAVNQEGYKVKYGDTGIDLLFFEPNEELIEPRVMESADKFIIHGVWVRKDKWRILPKYVSFEEAMKALKEGKTVYCHPNWCNGKHKIEPLEAKENAIEFLLIKSESLLQIVFESKWTIEEGIQ